MLATSYRTATFQSNDVEIFYRLFGAPGETPILIVHGLSYFSYDWIDVASALAVDRQVAAMDMRGFGDSGWSKNYSAPAFAGDIIRLLDHLGWREAIVIGHSMGGRNSAFCAAEYPDRISGLILVDWSPDVAPAGSKRVGETVAGTPEVFPSIDDAMHYFKLDPHSPQGQNKRPRFEAYLNKVAGGFAIKRDPHFREEFRRRLAGEKPKLLVDFWAVVAKIACPTLVIRGMRSDMFAAETMAKLRNANSKMQVVEVDAGHHVAGENLDGFLEKVKAYLQKFGEK